MRAAGGFPFEFVTISVSDGISMGHEGMHASLVSREIIADSVETVMHAERFDAFVGLAGCDKSAARHAHGRRPDRPSDGLRLRRHDPAGPAAATGPSTSSRCSRRSARAAGTIDDEELSLDRAQRLPDRGLVRRHVHRQHHGLGGRGARHGAAGRAGAPAVDRRRDDLAFACGRGGGRLARAGHPAAPDHDQGGLRERHRRR